jgi:alanine racemase
MSVEKKLKQSNRPRLMVDLPALQQNFVTLQKRAKARNPKAQITCTVKANAYGLGLARIAPALREAGAEAFFVAYSFEARKLRKILGGGPKIYVFNGPTPGQENLFREEGLIPVLSTLAQLRLWADAGPGFAPCALHIDTAMNRLGLGAAELNALMQDKSLLQRLDVKLILSHLACGSDPQAALNHQQCALFEQALRLLRDQFPDSHISMSASAGLFLDLNFSDNFVEDIVRPGIALYGGGPQDRPESALAVVASLQAPVLQLRKIAAGQSVGYGASYIAEAPRKIATLAIGYGDGFARCHGGRGMVYLGGQLCPIIGRVSMDLITIDVSDLPAPPVIGDFAEIFGTHIAIEDAAKRVDTISYELLVTLGERVVRVYG